MWVVTELFVTRHRGFVMPQWTVLYWDKDRGLWLIPDWVLTQARRKLLQQESERD